MKFRMISLVLLGLVILPLATAAGGCPAKDSSTENEGDVESLRVTSQGIKQGERIPVEYTAEGDNDSPELSWSTVDGAASYALINDDPDAPGGTWVHWLVYNIPPGVTELERGFPASGEIADGTLQGTTSKRDIGYSGPLPPPGPDHRYFFKIYALDAILDLPAGATKEELVDAMAGHVLDEGQLMGTYSR